jgi:hypothetical protein
MINLQESHEEYRDKLSTFMRTRRGGGKEHTKMILQTIAWRQKHGGSPAGVQHRDLLHLLVKSGSIKSQNTVNQILKDLVEVGLVEKGSFVIPGPRAIPGKEKTNTYYHIPFELPEIPFLSREDLEEAYSRYQHLLSAVAPRYADLEIAKELLAKMGVKDVDREIARRREEGFGLKTETDTG